MRALVIAEHDNGSLKAATLNTVSAAAKLGGDIDVLVAGAAVAGELVNVSGASRIALSGYDPVAFFVDGKAVTQFQPYGGMVVKPGDRVEVRQISLSEEGYRYYVALTDQVTNDGSPFAVSTASVRGNVANLTRPSRRALGYFMAGEVSSVRKSVPTTP